MLFNTRKGINMNISSYFWFKLESQKLIYHQDRNQTQYIRYYAAIIVVAIVIQKKKIRQYLQRITTYDNVNNKSVTLHFTSG